MVVKLRTFFTIALAFSITSCNHMPEWMGAPEKIEKVEGDRIAVLKQFTNLKPDSLLEDVHVELPEQRQNISWLQSHFSHETAQGHLALSKTPKKVKTVNVGKGAKKDFRLSATPVIANHSLFILDGRGTVTAYDIRDFKDERWQTKLITKKQRKDIISGGIAFSRGTLFVSFGLNELVALNAENGQEIWRKQLKGIVRAAPAVDEGVVLVTTTDNHSIALKAKDGSLLWKHEGITEQTSVFGSASPALVKEVAIVPYSSGDIHAINAKSGKEVWTDNLATSNRAEYALSDIDATPVISDKAVYVASHSGLLSANDLLSGVHLWDIDIPVIQTPWLAGEYLYVLSTRNELVSLHTREGRIKWVTELPGFKGKKEKGTPIHWSHPVLAGGQLLVVGSHGKMLLISPETGEINAKVKVPGDIYLAPVIAHNKAFLLTNEANLVVLE